MVSSVRLVHILYVSCFGLNYDSQQIYMTPSSNASTLLSI